ncbi:hypothetical protein RN001_003726 [Aquatica leii]|uniref:MADF domain-containing protein n=1 Tax=Aquatica leii TaxID=1421715 RepID=A0AAN7PFI0_9COLE|nr:hypothetical protein RN001_003726 [Aquatica leii]
MASGWSREEVSLLIDLYRERDILYNVKMPMYHNKHARTDAFEEIVRNMQENRPNTTDNGSADDEDGVSTPTSSDIPIPSLSLHQKRKGVPLRNIPPQKRKAESDATLPVFQQIGNAIEKITNEHDDQWGVFGKFVAEEIKNIKNEKNRKRCKREIIMTLLEYQEEDDSD